MSSYDNGTDGTCLQETEPRTCPLLTVNYKTLDFFKKDPRYMQLHFDIELSVTLSDPTLLRWLRLAVTIVKNSFFFYLSQYGIFSSSKNFLQSFFFSNFVFMITLFSCLVTKLCFANPNPSSLTMLKFTNCGLVFQNVSPAHLRPNKIRKHCPKPVRLNGNIF